MLYSLVEHAQAGLTLVLTWMASLHKVSSVLLFEEGTVMEMTVVVSFSASGITSFSIMSLLYLFWLCTNRNEKLTCSQIACGY